MYNFVIAAKLWLRYYVSMNSPSAGRSDFLVVLTLTVIIFPLTAEVERPFSLMKLICIRTSLPTEKLSYAHL